MRRSAAGVDAENAALARLAGDDVWRLLPALDESERAAIVLAYFGGLHLPRGGHLLQHPEGTVKSRIGGGFARLRATLLDLIRCDNHDLA